MRMVLEVTIEEEGYFLSLVDREEDDYSQDEDARINIGNYMDDVDECAIRIEKIVDAMTAQVEMVCNKGHIQMMCRLAERLSVPFELMSN